MSELELKFRLKPTAVTRWLKALKTHGATQQRLRSIYFDTADGRLAQAGMAVRLRLEGERWVQTVKAVGSSPIHRLEHEVLVPGSPSSNPNLALSRHLGSAVAQALEQALDGSLTAPALLEMHKTDVQRWMLHVTTQSGTHVEWALDLGEVRTAGRSEPIAELELEYVEGPVDGLFRMARDVAAEGGLWLSTLSKAERGELLKNNGSPEVHKAQAIEWGHHAHGADVMRSILANVLDQVMANASGIAEGHSDTDRIHQLRLGLRRLRTALRDLSFLCDRIDPAWEDHLKTVFRVLGEQRDSAAMADTVAPLLQKAGAPKVRWTLPAEVDLAALVQGSDFQQTLLSILGLVHADDAAFNASNPSEVRKRVAQALGKLQRQVLKAGRRFDSLPAERQHQARKRLKRLRYLAEFTHGLWPQARGARYLKRLRPAQDMLGVHSDCVSARDHFRQDAMQDPRSWFAVGFLQGHLALTARDARRAIRQLGHAQPFWC